MIDGEHRLEYMADKAAGIDRGGKPRSFIPVKLCDDKGVSQWVAFWTNGDILAFSVEDRGYAIEEQGEETEGKILVDTMQITFLHKQNKLEFIYCDSDWLRNGGQFPEEPNLHQIVMFLKDNSGKMAKCLDKENFMAEELKLHSFKAFTGYQELCEFIKVELMLSNIMGEKPLKSVKIEDSFDNYMATTPKGEWRPEDIKNSYLFEFDDITLFVCFPNSVWLFAEYKRKFHMQTMLSMRIATVSATLTETPSSVKAAENDERWMAGTLIRLPIQGPSNTPFDKIRVSNFFKYFRGVKK